MRKSKTVLITRNTPVCLDNIFACKSINYEEVDYPIYIIDKSVLLTCPDIVPDSESWRLGEFYPELRHIHFIIPTSVIMELKGIKQQDGLDWFTAKELLNRIRYLLEDTGYLTRPSSYGHGMTPAIYYQENDILFTILQNLNRYSISREFELVDPIEQLVSSVDQIIHSIRYSTHLELEVNSDMITIYKDRFTILSNSPIVSIRARAEGVRTKPFRSQSHTYTGVRNVIVPFDLYSTFLESSNGISYEEWQFALPGEPALIANEFINMAPQLEVGGIDQVTRRFEAFSYIGRYDCAQKRIVHLKYYKNLGVHPRNDGQAMYAEAVAHPDISVVLVTGPAGTGKTFLSTIGAIKMQENNQFTKVIIVPCSIDVQQALGFLPGDLNEKLSPNIAPIKNAIENYLKISDSKIMKAMNQSNNDRKRPDQQTALQNLDATVEKIYEKVFKTVAVEVARGLDFSDTFVIYDEFQDQSIDSADMLLKRHGKNNKMIISGDIEQIHQCGLSTKNNGLVYAKTLCTGLPMVAQITLQDDEIVRDDFVKEIIKRQHE